MLSLLNAYGRKNECGGYSVTIGVGRGAPHEERDVEIKTAADCQREFDLYKTEIEALAKEKGIAAHVSARMADLRNENGYRLADSRGNIKTHRKPRGFDALNLRAVVNG